MQQAGQAQIIQGDALDVLRTLPAESVQCVVCSPPYFGLRDYGTAEWDGGADDCDHAKPRVISSSTLRDDGRERIGTQDYEKTAQTVIPYRGECGKCGATRIDRQIGLESTPSEYIDKMVAVFREVRRVLRKDGVCWLNIGDSYGAVGGDTHTGFNERWNGTGGAGSKQDAMLTGVLGRQIETGLRPKNLLMMPARVALALQADGWYLRQDIIWHKPNPMPESVTDRCTKAHEYIFLLSKSERYYYDAAAISEASSDDTHARNPGSRSHKGETAYLDGAEEHRTKAGLVAYSERQRTKYKTPDGWDTRIGQGGHGSFHSEGREKGRKLADVGSGTKNNASFDEAMAVMPERRNKRSVWTITTEPYPEAHFATFPTELPRICILAGSRVGDTVLDPFAGSGTTLQVALELSRAAIGIELNAEYVALANRRLNSTTLGLPLEIAA